MAMYLWDEDGFWPIFVYAICPICPRPSIKVWWKAGTNWTQSNWHISLKIRLSLWTKKRLWVSDVCLDYMRIIDVHKGDTMPPHQVAKPILPEDIWVLVLDDFMLYINPISTIKMLRNQLRWNYSQLVSVPVHVHHCWQCRACLSGCGSLDNFCISTNVKLTAILHSRVLIVKVPPCLQVR
jgi:hypothetical protein